MGVVLTSMLTLAEVEYTRAMFSVRKYREPPMMPRPMSDSSSRTLPDHMRRWLTATMHT